MVSFVVECQVKTMNGQLKWENYGYLAEIKHLLWLFHCKLKDVSLGASNTLPFELFHVN